MLARTKGVCANYKLPRAASLDPIRSLFSGVMQLIEVIRRGFWVNQAFIAPPKAWVRLREMPSLATVAVLTSF